MDVSAVSMEHYDNDSLHICAYVDLYFIYFGPKSSLETYELAVSNFVFETALTAVTRGMNGDVFARARVDSHPEVCGGQLEVVS